MAQRFENLDSSGIKRNETSANEVESTSVETKASYCTNCTQDTNAAKHSALPSSLFMFYVGCLRNWPIRLFRLYHRP